MFCLLVGGLALSRLALTYLWSELGGDFGPSLGSYLPGQAMLEETEDRLKEDKRVYLLIGSFLRKSSHHP